MTLEPRYLTWQAVFHLGANLRAPDLQECLSGPPMEVLAQATTSGQAWTATSGPTPEDILGAFGYTDKGTIWSLWRDLSREESMAVLLHTPLWVRTMLVESHREWLYNYVSKDNQAALAWLKMSGCFFVGPTVVSLKKGLEAYYFRTHPLQELPGSRTHQGPTLKQLAGERS